MLTFFLLLAHALSEYVEFEVTDSITWGWEFLPNDIIRFTLKCKVDGYCSIGLGNSRMFPTDMMAVIRDGSSAEVADYWASAYGAPGIDTSRSGGSEDYTLITGSYNGSILSAVFDRKLKTGDKWDTDIVEGDKIDYIYAAHGSDTSFKTFHSSYGNGEVTMASTQAGSSLSSDDNDSEDTFETHGTVMSILWIMVTHVAVITARYFKFCYWWYWIHTGLFMVVSGFTYASVMGAYNENEASQLAYIDDNKIYHSRLGFMMASVVTAQVFMGILSRLNVWCNKSNIHVMQTLRTGHQILGWTLAVIALVQIYYGWDVFDDDYDDDRRQIAYSAYIILCLIYFVLEINHQLGARYLPHPILECRRCGLPEMSHNEAMDLVKSGRKLVFYDDLVLDVRNYRWSHPGGAIMLNKSIGQDVGKFLNGCSSIGGDFNAYTHSHIAFKLARQLAIAKLPQLSQAQSATDNKTVHPDSEQRLDTEDISVNIGSCIPLRDASWNFIDKTKIANDTYDFRFQSDSVSPPSVLSGVSNMGQHFAVTLGGVTRYYSFCVALHPDHAQALKNRAAPVDSKSGELHLYLKVYPQGKLTQKLANMETDTSIRLKGPMGPGLMLTPDTSGHCVGIGGGTGVIPFLDLVEHLYWQKVQPTKSTSTFAGLKLTLYVSFRTKDDVFCSELLDAAADAYRGDDTFQLYSSLDAETGRINQALVDRLVPQDVTYAWVCGPSGFNAAVREMLEYRQVKAEAIVLL